jgi:hypothetical protein
LLFKFILKILGEDKVGVAARNRRMCLTAALRPSRAIAAIQLLCASDGECLLILSVFTGLKPDEG